MPSFCFSVDEWLIRSVRALIWTTASSTSLERKKVASFFTEEETDDLTFLKDLLTILDPKFGAQDQQEGK